jgi:hypothetical protein
MTRILSTAVAIAAALTLGGPAMAAQAAHTKAATTAKAQTPKSQSAMGKVTKYDASTRTLTISTKKGEESFVLASDARVMDGAKSVTDLSSAVGENAKVHYTEANGVKTAQSISVSGASMAKANAKPAHAASKQPKK